MMKTLQAARTDVGALIKNYQSPKLAAALKKEEQEKAAQLAREVQLGEIQKLTALINARSELITEKEKELATEKDPARKGALKTFIASLRKAQEGTETALIQRSSELAAL